MVTAEILNSHTVKTLRSEISKQNIKGYSKTGVKKPQLIALMLKNKERFMHIKMNEKPAKKEKAEKKEKPKPASAKKEKKTKGSHAMPNGALMSGKVHSKESKILTPKQIEAELEKRFGKIETKQQLQLLDNLIKKAKKALAKGKKKDEDPFGTGFGFTISKGTGKK